MNETVSPHRADFDRIFATLLAGAREALEASSDARASSRFFPLGASLGIDDTLHGAMAVGGEQPAAMMARMRDDFRRQAVEDRIKACGIAYDAQFEKEGVTLEAIATWLEHRQGEAVVIYVPYRMQDGKLQYGRLLATDTAPQIWPLSRP